MMIAFFTRRTSVTLGITIGLCGVFYAQTSEAIPEYARSYKTSCMTCHAGYPTLNNVGESFKQYGFMFPEGSKVGLEKKSEPVNLGAPATKAAWPNVTWPGEIPAVSPLAVRLEMRYNADTTSSGGDDLTVPNNIYLLMGGPLGEKFSYFAHLHAVAEGESGMGVARAWLRANSLFEDVLGPQKLNLKVGLVEPASVPFSQFMCWFSVNWNFPVAV